LTSTAFASILHAPVSPTLRALAVPAASPERFLSRGLKGRVERLGVPVGRPKRASARSRHAVALPEDLDRWVSATAERSLGDFLPPGPPRDGNALASLLAGAARSGTTGRALRDELAALLAGAIPFGATHGGELWLYVVAEPGSPARGVIATLHGGKPQNVYRSLAAFAVACTIEAAVAAGEDQDRAAELCARLGTPGVAEEEAVRAAFERAEAVTSMALGSDAVVRRAARRLAGRPLDAPHPPESAEQFVDGRASKKRRRRSASRGSAPLAFGPLLEAFFREPTPQVRALVDAQRGSIDALVRDAATLLGEALGDQGAPKPKAARDLSRRRELALRAARPAVQANVTGAEDRSALTRRIAEAIDAMPVPTDPLATSESRDEALLALAELGDRTIVPSLVARAVTGNANAVDMLGALADARAVGPLTEVLEREPQRYRQLESAVVRALASLDARGAAGALRSLLAANPMPTWREGIERGSLVRELVTALGELADERAGAALLHVLEERSQEYRAILPIAAWALGRIHHLPALPTFERLLSSPKEPQTCETIWAVGAVSAAHPSAEARATSILEGLTGLEPGAEMVRLTALVKTRARKAAPPRGAEIAELRRALERALWEPGFRQEETARRRIWALRSLEELASSKAGLRGPGSESAPFFLGHEAVRYFVTRDDQRVRRAAEASFAAWSIPVPATRRYFVFLLDELERGGGVGALHDALRDPLGGYRHNVATRLAGRAHPSSVRPLAEATARLFAEPPTSTYEYDDAPSHLVAFVRAVARLNSPEGNDVLIEGLRNGNHQVRAVVAENAPDDERFVPELMAMLGDPRSFLRSRAERSLATLGVRGGERGKDRTGSDAPPARRAEV